MNSVEQTSQMLQLFTQKVLNEQKKLETAFQTMDFDLLCKASKELNLYAHRGYDLTVGEQKPARFQQTSRREFMERIQSDFQTNGIEIRLPAMDGYSGEAIYFYAFGERIGVLYGETTRITGNIRLGNTQFFHERLQVLREEVANNQEDVNELEERVRLLSQLLSNPHLLFDKVFANELKRHGELNIPEFHFHHPIAQRFLGSFLAKRLEKKKIKQAIERVETPESRVRIENYLENINDDITSRKERVMKTEEIIVKLQNQEPAFEQNVLNFFALLEKYNILYTEKE